MIIDDSENDPMDQLSAPPRRLKILFAGYSLKNPLGGGELSARTLVTALSGSHDVEALCVGRIEQTYEIDGAVRCRDMATTLMPPPFGVPFHIGAMLAERQFRTALAHAVSANPPDLLILQQPAFLRPADVPRATTVVIFLRSAACYGVSDANPTPWRRAVSGLFRRLRFASNEALLHRAELLVCNSAFLQSVVLRSSALTSHVVHPFIAPRYDAWPVITAPADRDAITFVGLDVWKGAEIAIDIAAELPNRRFLFLSGARASGQMTRRASALSNVTCLAWTSDMASIFARTRLLLMPSIWEEPFGRLPVEAGAFGIPTLASARGGLPESVGKGGVLIDPPDDISLWTRQIDAFDDAAHYAHYSAEALRHAESFSISSTIEQFARILKQETDITLSSSR